MGWHCVPDSMELRNMSNINTTIHVLLRERERERERAVSKPISTRSQYQVVLIYIQGNTSKYIFRVI